MILLTSFVESQRLLKRDAFKNQDVELYSVSRFQPAGFNYKDLPFLAAMNRQGGKLSLTEAGSLENYKEELYDYYDSRWEEIGEFILYLSKSKPVFLCCWCPHAEHSKRQLAEHDTFVCHTGLIGLLINNIRPRLQVYMDMDHHQHLVDDFKPHDYKPLIL